MPKNIFLSHSHDNDDQLLAQALQEVIKECCPQGTEVFRSSDIQGKHTIAYGEDWYHRVTDELRKADAIIALITPASSLKPWVLYELGFAKGKGVELLYGIVAPSISQPDLGPLSQVQAAFFTRDGIHKVLRELAQFAGTQPVDSQLDSLTRSLLNRVTMPLTNISRSGIKRQEPLSSFLELGDRLLQSIDEILSTAESSDGVHGKIRRWTAAASLCSVAVPWIRLPLSQLYDAMVADDAKRLTTYCDELIQSFALVEQLTSVNPSPNLEDACSILRASLDDIRQNLSDVG